jgi:threonine/homoserine/homoserine lactone efflux protein
MTLISAFAYAVLATFGVAALLWMGSGQTEEEGE